MGDGTAQGTSKSEARVEIKALRLLLGGGLGQSSRRGSHCNGDECARRKGISGDVERWESKELKARS